MDKFVRNLITEWRRLELPFDGKTVVLAISGGADSVSLLLALNDLVIRQKLDLRIVAAHFNHRLRGDESDRDEDFVRDLTKKLGVELAVGHGRILVTGNLEQNAREARYEFLQSTALNLDAFAVLTGHTINDQAETFLLNLIRGSGPAGLSGMQAVRRLQGGDQSVPTDLGPTAAVTPILLVRPLLCWAKRHDTEAFCHQLEFAYRYDTMNEDTAFKRVRIRKILLPMLEDFNPKIIEILANTAGLMRHSVAIRPTGNQLPITDELILDEVNKLATPELYDVIRSWLRQHRGTTRRLQLKHIEAIARLIFSPKSGRFAELPGGRVIKTGGHLVYDENKVEN